MWYGRKSELIGGGWRGRNSLEHEKEWRGWVLGTEGRGLLRCRAVLCFTEGKRGAVGFVLGWNGVCGSELSLSSSQPSAASE